jgi:predicted ATPase
VLDDARSRDLGVFAGRAEELERTRPFGVWAEALGCSRSSPDPRRAALAALLATRTGEHGPITVSSDPGLQFQAIDALVDLAEELALDGPLVIGLDDLQWADPSSLLTLAALARRLTYAPVGVIGCVRPTPRGGTLDRVLETLKAAGGRRLQLGALGADAVLHLVSDVVAALPGQGLMAELSGAAGNPLYVTELLAAIIEEGAVRTVDGRAEVAETTLPPTLRLTILRHLSFLPDERLDALRPASILGSRFLVSDLAATTERSVLDLTSVLAPAIAARILEDDGDRLRFRHDLVREAVYGDVHRPCAGACTARRARGWRAGERLRCRWPSTWGAM